MTKPTQDEMRAKFEEWAKANSNYPDSAYSFCESTGNYDSVGMSEMWRGYQAATTESEKRIKELVETLGYAAQVLPDAMAFIDRGLHKDSFNLISSVYGNGQTRQEIQLANLLRTAGEVLHKEGYISLSEQIDATLVNYGHMGITEKEPNQ